MRIIIILIIFLLTINSGFGQENKLTKIFLIRHTETLDDGTRDPKLSNKGIERAKKWAAVLQSEKIDKVYSTNLKRTQALAGTIANSQGIDEVITYERDMDMATFLKEIEGKTVVISGHSNTTPFLVNKLIGKEKYEQIDDADYESLFIVNYYSKSNVSDILLKID